MNEITPALPALPNFELEYDDGLELSSEISPLEVEKDIAPPFPALPKSACEYEDMNIEPLSEILPLVLENDIAPPFFAHL